MKIDRLISIIMILLERRRTTIPELARLCEVSTRTISRDLDAINQAGIPLVTFPGVNGGVGIMDGYKLEKRLFSTADVATLLMGLGCIRTSLSGDEVVGALAKVQGLVPEERRREIELRAGRYTIDPSPWVGGPAVGEAFDLVEQAMEESRLVRFRYADRLGQESEREVEPYRLVLKGARWYVDAYCRLREDFRLFKIARMTGVELLETRFEPREHPGEGVLKPQFEGAGVVAVRLFVRAAGCDRFLDWFGPGCVGEAGDDGFFATVSLPPGERGFDMVLGFGDQVECVGPPEYREGFAAYMRKIASRYGEAS